MAFESNKQLLILTKKRYWKKEESKWTYLSMLLFFRFLLLINSANRRHKTTLWNNTIKLPMTFKTQQIINAIAMERTLCGGDWGSRLRDSRRHETRCGIGIKPSALILPATRLFILVTLGCRDVVYLCLYNSVSRH